MGGGIQVYNALLKRTSSTYLVILGGAVFFQAGIDPAIDGYIAKRNAGVSLKLPSYVFSPLSSLTSLLPIGRSRGCVCVGDPSAGVTARVC